MQAFDESHESDHEEYDVGAVGGYDDQLVEFNDTAADPLGLAADVNPNLNDKNEHLDDTVAGHDDQLCEFNDASNECVDLFDGTVADGHDHQLGESNGNVADLFGPEANAQLDGTNEHVTDYLEIEQVDGSGMVKEEVLELFEMRASLEHVNLSSASDIEIVAEYYEEEFLAQEINIAPEAANEVVIDGANQ